MAPLVSDAILEAPLIPVFFWSSDYIISGPTFTDYRKPMQPLHRCWYWSGVASTTRINHSSLPSLFPRIFRWSKQKLWSLLSSNVVWIPNTKQQKQSRPENRNLFIYREESLESQSFVYRETYLSSVICFTPGGARNHMKPTDIVWPIRWHLIWHLLAPAGGTWQEQKATEIGNSDAKQIHQIKTWKEPQTDETNGDAVKMTIQWGWQKNGSHNEVKGQEFKKIHYNFKIRLHVYERVRPSIRQAFISKS